MNDDQHAPQPEFKMEDAARIIGNLVIENDVLRRGLLDLKGQQAELKKQVESVMRRPPGPTRVMVDRAEEPDAPVAGET